MNQQHTFDTVVAHLFRQNAKADRPRAGNLVGWGAQCVYRTHDGKKCAVGCLIPDDSYRPIMEGKGVTSDRVKDGIAPEHYPETQEELNFLQTLQVVHDDAPINSWPQRLGGVADGYQLDTFVLRNCLRFWTPPA